MITARGTVFPPTIPNPGVSDGNLYLGFLQVGQGDCTFIHFPDGTRALIDCGSSMGATTNGIGAQLPYHNRSLGIDCLVLTHSDIDHNNFVGQMLGGDPIGRAYRGSTGWYIGDYGNWWTGSGPYKANKSKKPAPATPRLGTMPPLAQSSLAVDTTLNINATTPAIVTLLPTAPGPFRFEAIAANVPGTAHTDNAWNVNTESTVTRIVFGNDTVLMMGDGTCDTEAFLRTQARATPHRVFRAGHHGSTTSSSAAFLDAVVGVVGAGATTVVMISAGNNAGFKHPRQSICARLQARMATTAPARPSGWWQDNALLVCQATSQATAWTAVPAITEDLNITSVNGALWLTMDGT